MEVSMSQSGPLSEREKAFEDLFFQKESERLLEAMRTRKSREKQFEALSGVLGVDAPDLIDPLLELGLREENVAALVLAPLVVVAWADHRLDDAERQSILKAENDFGIDPKSDAGKLLAVWLEYRPHESLLDAWAAYVVELCRVLQPDERTRLRDDIVSRSQRIASAVEKSILRAGGPTDAEKAALAGIESAFR
jgi:hypothetical protein